MLLLLLWVRATETRKTMKAIRHTESSRTTLLLLLLVVLLLPGRSRMQEQVLKMCCRHGEERGIELIAFPQNLSPSLCRHDFLTAVRAGGDGSKR